MTPLGGLDALFLHLETPATPMHVGALNLLEAPAQGDDLYEAIAAHVSARLSASPVFTRRLLPTPLAIANPMWVDAGAIDLSYHLKRLRLPAPGTQAQLEAAVARLHGERLDRRRPLWQFWLIEGLADGGHAWYSKVHHAAVDGAAGVALAQALLDTSPQRAPSLAPAAADREQPVSPGVTQLLGTVLAHNVRSGLALARQVPALARAVGSVLRSGGGKFGEWARHFEFAPPTVFNGKIDGTRRIALFSASLAQVRAIADAHGATVNDVVLAIVAGALRRVLEAQGELPERPLSAAMPLSLRESGDARMNTQAWLMPASLATDIADPVQRLRAIHAAAATAKTMTRDMRPALDLSLPSLGAPWLLTAAAELYAAAAQRLPRLANVVVSNVPGPPVPLYLAGARLRGYWPLSIVEHGLGLNVTVMRYVDSLDFGVVAARRLVPDLAPLTQALQASLAELHAATAPPREPRRDAALRRPGPPPMTSGSGRKRAAVGARSRSARMPRGESGDTR